MSRFFFILLIISFFAFVFFKSDTLETIYTTATNEVDVEYVSTRYKLRWDRFFDYLQNLPHEFKGKAKSLLGK